GRCIGHRQEKRRSAMTQIGRAKRFFAAATLLLLPFVTAAPTSADMSAGLRGALEHARRDAQHLRRDATLAQMSQDSAIQLNRRIDELERLIQSLTNKIDSLEARNRELARDFERFKNDAEFRLSQAEKGTRAPARPPERNQPDRSQPERKADLPPDRRAVTPPATPPSARNNNGNDADDDPPPRQARRGEEPAKNDADTGKALPGGTARDQYDHALGLLRRADYKGAEAALREFVRRNPTDPLAANGYYWLGENYYAQARYQDAAAQFAEGYRKFPNHPKAQDNLFKLALSAARQGKTGEACSSFGEFRKRYPNAGLRREAEAEQRRLHCPA
ncbi:MAG: tol-pal system protein YbgF, partial [Alphaproteobacteria bacterium]